MWKRILTGMLAVFMACGVVYGFNDDDVGGERRVHIILHDSSDVEWADLLVDGQSRGVVRKGSPLILTMQGGSSYLFRVTRTWNGRVYVREKLQRIEPGAGAQWIVLMPEIQDRDGAESRGHINITLPQASPVAWVNLAINDVAYGVMRRGETRRFWLKAGMTHKIRLEREWKNKTWVFEHEVQVEDGQTVRLDARMQAE
ncbi:MAG TPA: hypothetical protein PLD82_09280 [Spirochaetota bacterium]|nr:hypothetical protein [Spirochaetota bacterium]